MGSLVQIDERPSKDRKHEIAADIGSDPEKFAELWQLVKTAEPPIPRYAAWIMEEVTEKYPMQLDPWINDAIDFLPADVHDGVRRNLVKILSRTTLPEERHGELYDLCLKWLMAGHIAVAIKVWCMEICEQIARPYPELREELSFVIEEQLPFGSKGFLSRGKKILKKLRS